MQQLFLLFLSTKKYINVCIRLLNFEQTYMWLVMLVTFKENTEVSDIHLPAGWTCAFSRDVGNGDFGLLADWWTEPSITQEQAYVLHLPKYACIYMIHYIWYTINPSALCSSWFILLLLYYFYASRVPLIDSNGKYPIIPWIAHCGEHRYLTQIRIMSHLTRCSAPHNQEFHII